MISWFDFFFPEAWKFQGEMSKEREKKGILFKDLSLGLRALKDLSLGLGLVPPAIFVNRSLNLQDILIPSCVLKSVFEKRYLQHAIPLKLSELAQGHFHLERSCKTLSCCVSKQRVGFAYAN